MSDTDFLPAFPEDWEPTRATLHAYAHGVGAVPRTLAEPHPKWWHASLKVTADGLVTEPVAVPEGGTLRFRMDFTAHTVVLETEQGAGASFDMTAGRTGTEFADDLIAAAGRLGVEGEFDRSKFENDEDRSYDPAAAAAFWTAISNVAGLMETHKAAVGGDTSPVQVWPHGFDLSFEWFGTRVETYEEEGESVDYPSQLNFGFYPQGDAYFYSNPWPFEGEKLTEIELPHGAVWHTEGWEGTMLPYAEVAGDSDAEAKVAAYARAVFDAASPTLTG